MSNIIPDEKLSKTCKFQQQDCCRYILLGIKGWECGKHTKNKKIIDDGVSAGLFSATGDNCDGLK